MSGEIEHNFVQVNGVRLHIVSAGPSDGKPLVLLHGFPEFWYGWRHQIPALAEAGFRLIVPDQRGYNLSSVPKGVRAYGMDELVGDVIGLLDHFGLTRVGLVGHDWGAAVAWSAALAYPERVRKLAILNVPHPAVMLSTLRKSGRQMLRSWYIAFFQIPSLADGLMRLGHFAGAARLLRSSGKPDTFSDQELEEYRQAWTNSAGLTGMINWYRAALRTRSSLPAGVRVRVPTLILWGRRDAALGAEMAEASLRLCRDGRLIYFDTASHWVQHDEAQAVNRELIGFLNE
jgi:pimeloyl-ACP methyl ester carboxylesterase